MLPYLSTPVVTISYAEAGYVRLDWQPYAASAAELQALYEQVLQAMRRHGVTALLSVHKQRPPLSPDVQAWLTTQWIPRAVADAGYQRCAIVEADMPLGRLAARAVGLALTTPLRFRYFPSEAEAEAWLLS